MKAIIGWIITPLLEFLYNKISSLIAKAVDRFKKDKIITDDAKASIQKLKDAKTGADVDKATDDVLNNL